MRTFHCFLLGLLPIAQICFGQLPRNAETDLYFPHLVDGGPPDAQWQTRFTFINPNISSVSVAMNLHADGGGPLLLDFGTGPTSTVSFAIPPNGTYVLKSQIASAVTATGWADAGANLPVLGNVAFRLIKKGTATLEITAETSQPSFGYLAVAGPDVGVAVANVYSSTPLAVNVVVYDSSGNSLGQGSLTIPPLGHTAFNLKNVIANLPTSFTGNLFITPQTQGYVLLAWAVYADSSGVISSLPDGRIGFPTPHVDQIQTAFRCLVTTYLTYLQDFGATPQLIISAESDSNAINAFASNGTTVQINLALAELISDSPSEFAFIVGHELAHIYQQRTSKFVWNSDRELDADSWGLFMSFVAGYDPYAGAGVLGKLGMATGAANMGVQLWENLLAPVDAHGSFSTRIDNLITLMQRVCTSSVTVSALCSEYKAIVHPHLPQYATVPLVSPGGTK